MINLKNLSAILASPEALQNVGRAVVEYHKTETDYIADDLAYAASKAIINEIAALHAERATLDGIVITSVQRVTIQTDQPTPADAMRVLRGEQAGIMQQVDIEFIACETHPAKLPD